VRATPHTSTKHHAPLMSVSKEMALALYDLRAAWNWGGQTSESRKSERGQLQPSTRLRASAAPDCTLHRSVQPALAGGSFWLQPQALAGRQWLSPAGQQPSAVPSSAPLAQLPAGTGTSARTAGQLPLAVADARLRLAQPTELRRHINVSGALLLHTFGWVLATHLPCRECRRDRSFEASPQRLLRGWHGVQRRLSDVAEPLGCPPACGRTATDCTRVSVGTR
jgi:hypothetical protein